MSQRTSLILDERTRRAARQLAERYECSVSEAIRRAVLQQRDGLVGVTPAQRRERKRLLTRMTELFADSDPADEVARLKREDAGF